MKHAVLATGTLLAAAMCLVSAGGVSAVRADTGPSGSAGLAAALGPGRVVTTLGDRFTVRARVVNTGADTADPLLAHLNVVSLDQSVYVDPEDWSPSRTRQLTPLGAGSSTTVSWSIHAVNSGHFVVYVVVVPDGRQSAETGPLTVSSPTQVLVSKRRTLNPGGSLVVAVAVPLLVGAGALGARRRLRADPLS